MATLRVLNLTAASSSARTLRVAKLTANGTPAAGRTLRVAAINVTGTGSVAVAVLSDTLALEPGVLVTQTAALASSSPGTVTWAWTQVSGPTVTLRNATTATVGFVTPSVMPPTISTVVLGVTATVGGVTSPQQTASFQVYPQIRWVYDGTRLVGAVAPA